MKILSIETSCDETAVAVIELTGNLEKPAFSVLGHTLYSQAAQHAEFGGVYPSLAKREHQKNLIPLALKAIKESGLTLSSTRSNLSSADSILEREEELFEQLKHTPELHTNPGIDAIAVTKGPGLEPALWVGINFAKALSHLWNIPLVPINHMEGHIFSVLVDEKKVTSKKLFPAVALLVSGGHTELVLVKDWFEYEILGRTKDDAVGEAFDKVARLLELPYPGGPQISRLAEQARNKSEIPSKQTKNTEDSPFSLPRPMIQTDNYNFSYSGLKTAVRRITDKETLSEEQKQQLAREFEDAALDVLIHKTERALQEFSPQRLIVAGGVIANRELRKRLTELVERYGNITLSTPTPDLATDNAIMIGIAGTLHFSAHPELFSIFDPNGADIRANGNWRVDKISSK